MKLQQLTFHFGIVDYTFFQKNKHLRTDKKSLPEWASVHPEGRFYLCYLSVCAMQIIILHICS
jgi:hypothetical protein